MYGVVEEPKTMQAYIVVVPLNGNITAGAVGPALLKSLSEHGRLGMVPLFVPLTHDQEGYHFTDMGGYTAIAVSSLNPERVGALRSEINRRLTSLENIGGVRVRKEEIDPLSLIEYASAQELEARVMALAESALQIH